MNSKLYDVQEKIAELTLRAETLINRLRMVDRDLKIVTLGETAFVLAHEIRNPLGCIKFAVSMLAEKIEGAWEKKLIDTIQKSVQTIDETIEHILCCYKNKNFEFTLVNVTEVAAEAIKTCGEEAERLVSLIAPPFCYWYADKRALSRVFQNLIHNSLRALKNGISNPRASVNIEMQSDTLEINVIDNGGGFPDDFTESSIEPFKSFFPSGTGLGLAIVKQIVGAHGGRLIVQNWCKDEEKGALVRIQFRKA
ncbi:MAG: HAMP domain-containing histidine kinase [Deltaproteobacteria bacterium]|nr:HAMP domain-containing histidine kinase [Deltaproteobacteria bacterium]